MMKSILLLLFFLLPTISWCQKVVFISPGKSDEAYWVAAAHSMEMAATSLNMQLEVRFTERQHFKSIDIAHELVQRPKEQRPDYVIFSNDYGVAPVLLKIFSKTNIRSFTAFSSPTAVERSQTGEPRKQFKNWIGSLEPRADEAGYLTARALIEKGRAMKATSSDNKLHLIAISGDRSTNSSILRNEGMRRAVREASDVVLDQEVYADWSEKKAGEQATWLFQRYPNAKLIWGANDLIAFGAMRAFEKRGGIPGKTGFFSGINTSTEALAAIQSERLSALAGGHFITGAWAMIMIYDFDHGKDFASESVELTAPMFTLFTPEKVKTFQARFNNPSQRIDFRKYSKVLNPNIKQYEFGFEQFLK
jgi:hypothetical protein